MWLHCEMRRGKARCLNIKDDKDDAGGDENVLSNWPQAATNFVALW